MKYGKLGFQVMTMLAAHPEGMTRAQIKSRIKGVSWSSVLLPGGLKSGTYKVNRGQAKENDLYTLTRKGNKAYQKYLSLHLAQGKPDSSKDTAQAKPPNEKSTSTQATHNNKAVDFLDPIAVSHIQAMTIPADLNRALNKFILDISDRCAEFLTDYPNRKITSDLDRHNNTIFNKITQIQALIKG